MKGVMNKMSISGLNKRKITEREMKRLVESYSNDLLKLCTLYLKDRHLAEDALQDTFIKVWQKYYTYDKTLSSEKTWITRIAINTCKNYLRTSWFNKIQTSDFIEIVGQDEYTVVDEAVDMMNEILDLKEKYRVVLLMYYYEEYSVKEIAEILEAKQSTVLSLLARGRKQLKTKLDRNITKGVEYEF